jgi:hypothetical protein
MNPHAGKLLLSLGILVALLACYAAGKFMLLNKYAIERMNA